jgi:long-chain fatty acid transport protein
MNQSNRIMSVCITAALTAWSAGAWASAFQLMEQNASGLGNAYAGQGAAAENASTIFYNPAGMTFLTGRQISGSLSAIKPSVQFTNSGGSTAPGGLASPAGNSGDAGGWNYLPAVYLSWQLAPNWWAGVGVTSPFGLKTEYDAGWVGRFQSQKTELKTYDINPSIAYKFNDTVSLGGGVSYQHARLTLDRSLFVGVEQPIRLDVSDSEWGWNLGAMFNFSPSTRVGLTYRSSIGYTLSGNAVTSGAVVNAAPPVTANARVPATTSLALSHAFNDKLQLLSDVTFTQWSSIKSVGVIAGAASGLGAAGSTLSAFNLQFRDSYRIGAGLNYRWTDSMMVKVGVAYDKSPVDDAFRLTFLPDQSRTWLALGAKWTMSKQATVDFGYAHLFMKDPSISQSQGLGAGGGGNVIGTYKNTVNILSAQFTYAF